MSTNPSKLKKVLLSVFSFIQAESTYVSIIKKYDIELSKTIMLSQTTYANSQIMGQDLVALFTSWKQLKTTIIHTIGEQTMRQMIIEINSVLFELMRLKKNITLTNIEK